ncbi:DUF6416 domain-containing protein [Janibacter sp. G56]|uniref:DUF6416 domain-containing protein n=1 Tax=Janibacter sp. G56 TaxID=3418717 RepID=UPI003D00992F
MEMPDVTVPVPEERVPEFYRFFGAWLAGDIASSMPTTDTRGEGGVKPWVNNDNDLGLAQEIWQKLSPSAKAMFDLLMEEPGQKISGDVIAEKLDIPKGKYGVAGVLAWPKRYCMAVERRQPARYEDNPNAGSGNYWIDPEVADLFKQARDSLK